MAKYSPRVMLRMPERGVMGAPNDIVNIITDWNNAADKMDAGIGAAVYTSLTKPVNPYDGLLVYESDTQLLALWDSTVPEWKHFPAVHFAKGFVGHTVRTTDTANIATADGETGPHISVTFNAENGTNDRLYWCEFNTWIARVAGASPALGEVRIRGAAGAVVTTAGSLFAGSGIKVAGHFNSVASPIHKLLGTTPGITGQYTVGLFFIVTSPATTMVLRGSSSQKGNLIIRDVGEI